LDEEIAAFVAELVTTCGERVQRLVQVEIHVPVKVSTNKIMDFLFALSVQVLEFVKSRKLHNIQSIRLKKKKYLTKFK
jgi:hypothetical protein